MILVKFIKNSTPYMAGETAGFADVQAKALIARGVALAVGGPAPVATVVPPAQIVTKPMSESAPVEFDARFNFNPDTASMADVRAYLTMNGVKFHHKTGDAKLREMALEIVTGA